MSKGDSGLFSGTLGSPQLTFGNEFKLVQENDSVNANLIYTVKIKNEYLHGPIWVYSPNGMAVTFFSYHTRGYYS